MAEEKQEKIQEIDANKHIGGSTGGFFKAGEMYAQKIKVIITHVREKELQNSGLSLILDFSYRKEERSLPLNITNVKKMIELYGRMANKWIGQEITLMKVMATNPKTKQEVESLRIK